MNFLIDTGDLICDLCILIMRHMVTLTGISYGAINVLLFIVLGPLSTIFMAISALGAKYKAVHITFFVLALLIILFVCGIVLYTAMDMPFDIQFDY